MNRHTHDEIAMPALLRGARRAYGSAIRHALSAAGYDDIPENGTFVLGAIARMGASGTAELPAVPLSQVIGQLGASKQAAGQLVDTLVVRGYLDRDTDVQDRRRLTVKLSERGREVARIARAEIGRIDARLARRVDRQWIAHTRATLLALIESAHEH